MNTFASCGRQPIRMTGLTFFVIVMWAALLRAATVTPSDAVVTYVVVRALPSTQSAKIGKFSPRDRAEGLRKRVLNAQRQRAWRQRRQTIEALPRRINEALETGAELVKRATEGKRHLWSVPASPKSPYA